MNTSQRREDLLVDEQEQHHRQPDVVLIQPPAQRLPAFRPETYKFNLDDLKTTYQAQHSTWRRQALKWVFSIATLGLGALYLWATTIIVRDGEVAMRRDGRGKMVLLPPGRHSNLPWEAYEREKLTLRSENPVISLTAVPQHAAMPQNLGRSRLAVPVSENFIRLGPKTIFTVKTGYVAKTYRRGELVVFPQGQYCLEDAAHEVNKEDAFISIQEETKVLEPVSALTKNNVPLKIQADVRFKIKDAELAVTMVDGIEKTIFELAKINISQVVNHHDLSEFVPVTADPSVHVEGEDATSNTEELGIEDRNIEQTDNKGLSKILLELTRNLTEQFNSRGIELLSISTTSWYIDDAGLAHELGQVALIQAKARSTLLAAKQAKKVKEIEAEADANATRERANGQAGAVKAMGAAYLEVAQSMSNNPVAARMFQTNQQGEWFKEGRHTFFANVGTSASNLTPTLTIPAARGRSLSLGNAEN